MSYILDGEIAHHDTKGGGGVIGEGDTQWTTAGGGILPYELPTERMYRGGGPAHAAQLWVNLPRAPIGSYDPFVMNTREDILQAIADYEAGRLGIVPADQLAPRNYA